MIITQDQIMERLNELIHKKDQMMAEINATLGAIEECQFWLTKLDEVKNEDQTIERPSGSRD